MLLISTARRSIKLATDIHRRLYVSPHQTTRFCSSITPPDNKDDFKIVYRFPYIRVAKGLCKLKLYQTGIIVSIAGISTVSSASLTGPLIFSSFSLIMLGLMGEFFRKLVGIVYINPHTQQVKIAHLNFWGNRHDFICSCDDIVPLSDSRDDSKDIYVKVKFYDSKKSLLLSVKYGNVIEKEWFEHIFGQVSKD